MASPLISSAQHIDTPDRLYKNIRRSPDRGSDFSDVMGVREFSNYLMRIPELSMDFNDDVGSEQDGIVCGIEQSEFPSFTIHHDQRCICLQISAEPVRSDDPDRVYPASHAV